MESSGKLQPPGYQQERQSSDEWLKPYIECRDLFKIFKKSDLEVVALRGVDMEVEQGEMIAIVGASGSGKSTLLNLLSGLDRPSAGQVRVGHRDLLNISDSELVLYRRHEVGFVWQATARNLVPYLTARENIELPQAIAGKDIESRRSRSMELLSILDMKDKADRKIHQLSGGEQQRLAIAVGMANSPPLLLADEPTGELDTQMASQVFNLLREINRVYHATIVVVTHYHGVAEHMDRVLHIRDGRISSESRLESVHQGKADAVPEEYLVVDRVGRLQLPQEYVEKLNLQGLAKADIAGNQVNIIPASKRPRSDQGQRSEPSDSA
jgi:putative ABC transport system ATP-binding protein